MTSWTKNMVLEFIELYKSHECLWRTNSKDYKNRVLREKAYDHMAQFLKQFDRSAGRNTVTKKINNLRTNFRREVNKVESSIASGASEEDVYVPNLWYYPAMIFLRDQELPQFAVSNVHSTYQLTPSSSQQEDDVEADPWDATLDQNFTLNKDAEDFLCKEEAASESPSTRSPSPAFDVPTAGSSEKNPKAVKRRKGDQLFSFSEAQLQDKLMKIGEEDENDLYGKTVALKLRKLSPKQRFFAEKLMNDVLFEAGLEQLTRESHVVSKSLRAPSE